MTYLASAGAALFGSVSLWTGRANQAWGPSRVWNSGNSWEKNYNDQVTAYNTLQSQYTTLQANYNQAISDRDLWAYRANQAWGASRVWSNGESWEQAYNRVLPAGSGTTPLRWVGTIQTTDFFNSFKIVPFVVSSDSIGLGTGNSLVASKTGYLTVVIGMWPEVANSEHFTYNLYLGGGIVQTGNRAFNTSGTPVGTSAFNGLDIIYYSGVVTAGQSIQLQVECDSSPATMSAALVGSVEITFVPTQAYPH